MATKNTSLNSQEDLILEIQISDGVAVLSVDPGNSRGRGSGNPPITAYDITFEKLENNSYTEIEGSPISETSTDEQSWVTGNVGDSIRVTITNTGSRGDVVATLNEVTGGSAAQTLNAYTTVGEDVNAISSSRNTLQQLSNEPTDSQIPTGTTALYIRDDGNVYTKISGGSQEIVNGLWLVDAIETFDSVPITYNLNNTWDEVMFRLKTGFDSGTVALRLNGDDGSNYDNFSYGSDTVQAQSFINLGGFDSIMKMEIDGNWISEGSINQDCAYNNMTNGGGGITTSTGRNGNISPPLQTLEFFTEGSAPISSELQVYGRNFASI